MNIVVSRARLRHSGADFGGARTGRYSNRGTTYYGSHFCHELNPRISKIRDVGSAVSSDLGESRERESKKNEIHPDDEWEEVGF
jgi:hypothetical protein